MESKENKWMSSRLGRITASELGDIVSASGKIIDGNIDYIRKKRFERNHGFRYPISGKALELGKENEPYAIAWWRTNMPNLPVMYSQERDEIPFWTTPDIPNFGASPDAVAPDESYVVEVKCVVGNTGAEFYADPDTEYDEKRGVVLKEHGPQVMGQFLANPKVKTIYLLKYIYQRDDVDEDIDAPDAPWRGIVFEFHREDFDLEFMKGRIELFNAFIASDYSPKMFKSGGWRLDGGVLKANEE